MAATESPHGELDCALRGGVGWERNAANVTLPKSGNVTVVQVGESLFF